MCHLLGQQVDHNPMPDDPFSECPVLVKDVIQIQPRAGHSKGELELPLVILFPPLYTVTALVLILCFSLEFITISS